MKLRKCRGCGAEFVSPNCGQRYCADACRPSWLCAHCGKAFHPHLYRSNRNPRLQNKYCSNTCRIAALHEANALRRHSPEREAERQTRQVQKELDRYKTCPMCGVQFVASHPNKVYCTDECQARKQRIANQHKYFEDHAPRRMTSCQWCGACLPPVQPGDDLRRRKYCSLKCSVRAFKSSEKGRRVKRSEKAKRRARRWGLFYESFDPMEILERDRWRCQLCGVKTPRRLRGLCDEMAPELDHIVPLALGGGHTRENVQCLCRRCNLMKGVMIKGQLRLAG